MIITQPYFLFQTLFKFLILLGLFSYSTAHAEEPLITEGFEEVVLITADNSQWHRFFTHHAGWKKIDEGISDENCPIMTKVLDIFLPAYGEQLQRKINEKIMRVFLCNILEW